MTDETTTPSRPPEQIAIGLIQYAEAYRKAALMLHAANAKDDPRFYAPTYFLLCHAAELALKAFLAGHGTPERKLKRDFGHNLRKLYEAALPLGFQPPDDDFGELMDWFGPDHEQHDFRYQQPGSKTLPSPDYVAELFEPIFTKIEHTVRSRYMASQQR